MMRKVLIILGVLAAVGVIPASSVNAQVSVSIIDPVKSPVQTFTSGNSMSVMATVSGYVPVSTMRIKIVNRANQNLVYSSAIYSYQASPFSANQTVPVAGASGHVVECVLILQALSGTGTVLASDSAPINIYVP